MKYIGYFLILIGIFVMINEATTKKISSAEYKKSAYLASIMILALGGLYLKN